MPEPKIYEAASLASELCYTKPLNGTRKAAQSYVDRLTASPWWKDHWVTSRSFPEAPRRIWVWEGGPDDGGVYVSGTVAILNGEELPSVEIGRGYVNGDVEAIADKWVILHEVAHVMTDWVHNEGHHGKTFCTAYIRLVHRFLGREHGRVLTDACRELKIRLNYRLLLPR